MFIGFFKALELNLCLISDICKMAVSLALVDQVIHVVCVVLSFGTSSVFCNNSIRMSLMNILPLLVIFEHMYMLVLHSYHVGTRISYSK